jgi:hypothetical protein
MKIVAKTLRILSHIRPTSLTLRWFDKSLFVADYASKRPNSEDDDKHFVFKTSFFTSTHIFFVRGSVVGQSGTSCIT